MISTYAELKTAIADFINRDDLTSYLDNFIALAEARIVRDLKTSELQVTTTMTVDAQTETLPTDFAGMIRAHLGGSYPTLDYMEPDQFHSIYATGTNGRPIAYTIEGSSILFSPTPDDSYTLTYTYFAKPDIKTDTTNRLLTIYPDVYLFACLMEAADFVHDTEAMTKYAARYQQSVDSVNGSDQYKGRLTQFTDVP